jgi:hypothetical protein
MGDLRAALTGIYEKHGDLNDQLVVDEARPKTAPLHHRFEWDDSVAGEAYRRVQAAELIRSVKIRFDVGGERKSVRGFISNHEVGTPERGGYRPTEEVVQDELAMKILERELQRAMSDIKRKFGHLKEFAAILRAALDAA